MSDFWDSAWGIAAILLGMLLGVFFVTVISKAGMPGTIAQIEQLRHDASLVDPIQGERVIGQATEWNQTIRSNQAMNRLWWAGWVIPDEWDSIQIIEIPR